MAKLFAIFLYRIDSRQDIKGEILAIDCVDSSKLRIKIYIRSRETFIDSIADLMTMGGLLTKDGTDKAFTSLKDLWSHIFSLGLDFSSSAPLELRGYKTVRILYYLSLNWVYFFLL